MNFNARDHGLFASHGSGCCSFKYWELGPQQQWDNINSATRQAKTRLTNRSFRSHHPLQHPPNLTKSWSIRINFSVVFFFWLSIQKYSLNIRLENKHCSASKMFFYCLAKALWKHLNKWTQNSKWAITTQASSLKKYCYGESSII